MVLLSRAVLHLVRLRELLEDYGFILWVAWALGGGMVFCLWLIPTLAQLLPWNH